MTFETKYAQLGKRVKVSAHRRKPEVKAHSRRWPGGRSRQLPFAGPSVPSPGRVVIYRPQGLGKPVDVVIPIDKINDDIHLAVTDYFKDYGGIDSYGQAANPHKAYSFPSEGSWRQTVNTGRHGELLGTFKDWHRFDGNPPAWVKKSQITEVTQRQVDNAIQLVVHDAIVGWLKVNRGVKLEAIMDNIIGVTVAIGSIVKKKINADPWFKAFGLKVV